MPQSLESAADRAKALEELTDGFYAASSCSAVRARRSCYARILSLWGVQPLPLTVEKVLWLAAGLKARRYRSAASVLSQLRVDAERQGFDTTAAIRRALADAARSCRRGLGPVISARPLDFEALSSLPTSPDPWRPHGPIGPAAAMVVGAWWLLRETEAANLRAAHVVFANTRGVLTAELLLPASKGDQEARGVTRAQACICSSARRRLDCPAHAALQQMRLLRSRFPTRFHAAGPDLSLPFFPQASGQPCTKTGFAGTIAEAAKHQGLDESSADGTERISGHTLRVTGARGLATLGVDTYAIQLLGRWGSGVVLRYVKAAAVTAAAASARAASTAVSIQSLAAKARDAGIAGESCTESAVADLVELHLPGAVDRARQGLLAELREELAKQVAPRSASDASSSTSSTSTATTRDEDAAGTPEPEQPASPEESPVQAEGSASTAGPPVPVALSSAQPGVGASIPLSDQVSNNKHERRHVIVVGPPCLDPGAWITGCGWRFGRSGWAGAVNPSHEACRRCARKVGPGFQ